jgi:phage terminase large subunit
LIQSPVLDLPTPRVFLPLLSEARYKGAHGGRGSGKSHFFAESLVEKALMRPGLRWVCIREIQKSLEQSAKRLIEDKIAQYDLGRHFRVLDKHIETPGDGIIIFQGMQNHTAESIKSLEGYDGAWVEEAQSLSAYSLRLLRPTIRKPGSELWFSWNPESEEDPVDQLLRGPAAIENKIVVEANWKDNPWFPDVLAEEREDDQRHRSDEYEHVWEGGYLTISDALIFAKRVSIEDFEAPHDARFYFGADWGFASDPTALIRCFEKNDCLYIDYEAFGHGVEIDETPQLFDSIPRARKWLIRADSARPETISYMKRQGFRIEGAEKWHGSVEDGIARLKGFRKIVIHPRCANMQKEARLYSYKVDRQSEEVLPIVVDKHNHGWDATRYAIGPLIKRRSVFVSEEAVQLSAQSGRRRT